MTTPQSALKIKRIVWTGAIASITVVGTIYGAGLKTQGEHKQQVRKVRESNTRGKNCTSGRTERGIGRNGATVEESTRGMEREEGRGRKGDDGGAWDEGYDGG
ncbi:hypothetical protein DID88_008996 [Monilinia fructigena]|uniref:Uncharacterized protein n=1 Tax=Monilinia fructigena TaxID=38457 RepID=A0A395II10_9HELO|nr:hypothetical protein DID88_008996 [Monilinia fructigena]